MTEESIWNGDWHAQTYDGQRMASISYKGRRAVCVDFWEAMALRKMCNDAVGLLPTGRNRQLTPAVEYYAFSFKGIFLCKAARHSSVGLLVGTHVKAIMNNTELEELRQLMHMVCSVVRINKEVNEKWGLGKQK